MRYFLFFWVSNIVLSLEKASVKQLLNWTPLTLDGFNNTELHTYIHILTLYINAMCIKSSQMHTEEYNKSAPSRKNHGGTRTTHNIARLIQTHYQPICFPNKNFLYFQLQLRFVLMRTLSELYDYTHIIVANSTHKHTHMHTTL